MIVFPSQLLAPSKLRWRLAGTPISGGQPVAGPPYDGELSGGGWWEATHEISRVQRTDRVKLWRSIAVQLKNGAAQVAVPVLDWGVPWPNGAPVAQPLVTYSDGSKFSDGSEIAATTIAARLVGDAPLRAVSATIQMLNGADLQGGEYFTLVGGSAQPRLHLIGSVSPQGGGLFAVTFMPPLREDYADGADVDFERPRCTMKLDSRALDGVWPGYQAPFVASPSASFRETFDEPTG